VGDVAVCCRIGAGWPPERVDVPGLRSGGALMPQRGHGRRRADPDTVRSRPDAVCPRRGDEGALVPQLSLPPVSGLYPVRVDETEAAATILNSRATGGSRSVSGRRPAGPKAQVRSCCTLQRRPLPEGSMRALCDVKSLTVRGCE
jgi:hypothetical protein